MPRGFVHLYTGEGEGKTLSALGLALRAIGHGQKVIIIQFMKGRDDIGEYKIKERLSPNYEIYQFGREDFIDLEAPEKVDYYLAKKGIEFAKETIEKRPPDILILDEINLACAIDLVVLEEVKKIIEKLPEKTTLVLTGRKAPKELIEISDQANETNLIKHPFYKGTPARRGLDY